MGLMDTIKGWFGSASDTASDAADSAKDFASDAGQQISDTASDMGDKASDMADKASDMAGDAAQEVKETSQDAYQAVEDKVSDMTDSAGDAVDKHQIPHRPPSTRRKTTSPADNAPALTTPCGVCGKPARRCLVCAPHEQGFRLVSPICRRRPPWASPAGPGR